MNKNNNFNCKKYKNCNLYRKFTGCDSATIDCCNYNDCDDFITSNESLNYYDDNTSCTASDNCTASSESLNYYNDNTSCTASDNCTNCNECYDYCDSCQGSNFCESPNDYTNCNYPDSNDNCEIYNPCELFDDCGNFNKPYESYDAPKNCIYNPCNCHEFKDYIIGTDTKIKTNYGCKNRIFFDNGATTLISRKVMKNLNRLLPYYTYTDLPNYNSKYITCLYNKVRTIVQKYVGADPEKDTVIYSKNATDAINILSFAVKQCDPHGIVLTTKMEHLANYIPYKTRMCTKLINVTPEGNIDMNDYENKLKMYKGKVKLVAVTGASNVTGIVPPFYTMAKLAHKYGAKIFVDITQLLQHRPFSMKSFNRCNHIDFVAFSAHKCYSGLDGGALVGPADFLNKFVPLETGAGITDYIDDEKIIFSKSPDRYEPGYPNILGITAMGVSLNLLSDIGINNIANYEKKLYFYLRKKLQQIPGVKIYAEESRLVGIPFIAFNVKNIDFNTIASKIGYNYGIEITSGRIGADLYVQSLLGLTNQEAYNAYVSGKNYGLVRVSLGFYNTFDQVDRFICALKKVVKHC